MRHLRDPRAVAAVLLATAVVVACALFLLGDREDGGGSLEDAGDRPTVAPGFEDYCDEVADRRDDIGAAVAAGPETGLIQALPSFRALAEKAPDDIRDEWSIVIDRVEALQEAFEDAGVDPASYDRKHPPAGVSKEDRHAIEAAAVQLGSEETRAALASVDQQARDVCKTPLSM